MPLDPTFEHGLVVLTGALAVEGAAVAADELAYLGTGGDEIHLDAADADAGPAARRRPRSPRPC